MEVECMLGKRKNWNIGSACSKTSTEMKFKITDNTQNRKTKGSGESPAPLQRK